GILVLVWLASLVRASEDCSVLLPQACCCKCLPRGLMCVACHGGVPRGRLVGPRGRVVSTFSVGVWAVRAICRCHLARARCSHLLPGFGAGRFIAATLRRSRAGGAVDAGGRPGRARGGSRAVRRRAARGPRRTS